MNQEVESTQKNEIHENSNDENNTSIDANNTKENEIQNQEAAASEIKEIMSEEDINKGIEWHKLYYNMETTLPKYKRKNELKLSEAMKCAIKDEIIPILKDLLSKEIPDEASPKEVVNGYLCYCFHSITENAKHALGIINKEKNTRKSRSNPYEDKLKRTKRSKDAGERLVADIENIIDLRNQNLAPEVLQNREDEIFDDALKQANMFSDVMTREIFNTERLDREIVINTINDIIAQGDQTNILTFIKHAKQDIKEMESHHQKALTKKTRELFSLSPSRAMKYYIDPRDTPNCQIPLSKIRDELAMRWTEEYFEVDDEEDKKWETPYKLNEEDKANLLKMIQSEEIFDDVIKSRDITSAHGADGIGYWALKLAPKEGSEMMAIISQLIIKYGFIPTTWNRARTILLYKKGDPEDLGNWRPLNIASCLYRTWSCAVANSLQSINRNSTQLFDQNQKGFIKGIDGCLEHSNMITEILCDSNRTQRSLYITALDLRDAFGSIPHAYINDILKQMNFPEEITEVIKDSYDNGTSKVRIGNEESGQINIRKGVKQGCPLSPLIFNFCINPLLSKLEQEGDGYHIGENCKVVVQAYADDIVLFSTSREGMQKNLDIVSQFLAYSKVKVNVSKCRTISYVIRNNRRFYEEEKFTISNEEIPMSTLADSIEYLGTTAATTRNIRKHGTESVINEVRSLLSKIDKSVLSLNQKLYAIKTFALPMLDFVMMNGRVALKDMNNIDTKVRTIINKHVKGVRLPIPLFYTHWKDGGFSIMKLHERALCMRARSFMALANSQSEKTRTAMQFFIESERKHRGIEINKESDIVSFLNWRTPNKIHRGTDTIIMHGLRSSRKLNFTFKYDEIRGNVIAECVEQEKEQKEQENASQENAETENTQTVIVVSHRQLLKITMRNIRSKYREELIENKGTGHSFIDMKDAAYANKFIGDYTHPLNDNIASWIIKARCNMLLTGARALKMRIPAEAAPRCPYCGSIGDDTIAHRINGCIQSRRNQTRRHNNIQNIVLEYLKKRVSGNFRYKTNSTVNLEGKHIKEELGTLKPDIVVWNDKEIKLIEFSCPYANVGEKGNKLDNTFNEKVEKYSELVKECEEVYKRKVTLHVIIVSSLGVVQKDSIKHLRNLLQISNKEKKTLNTILRRLSLTACIGSFFIFNRLNFEEYHYNIETNSNDSEDGGDNEDTNSAKTSESKTEKAIQEEEINDSNDEEESSGEDSSTEDEEEEAMENEGHMDEDEHRSKDEESENSESFSSILE